MYAFVHTMPSIHTEARQVIRAILKDNDFTSAILELCHYLTDMPFIQMHILNHATSQIAKLPEHRNLYASTHAIHSDTYIYEMFPTFAPYVLPAALPTSTEAVLLAYSTYTVLANIFANVSFYLPDHDRKSHHVLTFKFMTLYYLIRAMHITMNLTPLVLTPDVDTVHLLSDWMHDLRTIITGPFFTALSYTPCLYSLIPYPDSIHLCHPSLPLKDLHPAAHRMILCSVHSVLQPLLGTHRPFDKRIQYQCKLVCLHSPHTIFERDSISDSYYSVTLDLPSQFAPTPAEAPLSRTAPKHYQFTQLLQSLPVEIRAQILNYHIENLQTLDCSDTPTPTTLPNKTSFIRCTFIPVHATHRRTSSTAAEFFVQIRNCYSCSRRNSVITTPHGQIFPANRTQRVHSPVHPAFQDMHVDFPNLSLTSKVPLPECESHSPILKEIHWTS